MYMVTNGGKAAGEENQKMMKHRWPKETRTAAQAYAEHEQAIEKALKRLAEQLIELRREHEADPRNWGIVGSIEEVKDRIQTTVSFLADEEE
jgi:sugar-specific transcriptional regulator TrmB